MRAPKNRLSVRALRSRLYKMRFFIDGKTMQTVTGDSRIGKVLKLQNPISKSQRNSNYQSSKPISNGGTDLEASSLAFGASMELGAWDLELDRSGAKVPRHTPNPPAASLWGSAPRFPPVSPLARSVRTPLCHQSRPV